ncbi:gibberellin 2-oxidase protein [Rutstroemia sp. NJR-2017a BVV2]|nr:gibberellin 2-oxidase protein [Rutstroemia sp. NJR-2017a BVV2]
MTISTLDITSHKYANPAEQKKFNEDLVASLSRYGFVKFVNHGISKELVKELFHWTRAIFEIPVEEKLKIMNLPGPRPQRGWSCVGSERTGRLYLSKLGKTDLENTLLDVREHFDQGSSEDKAWPNQWPEESTLPGFRAFMEAYYDKCQKVSIEILKLFESALDLSPGTFTSKISGQASETRLLHYPEVSIQDLKAGLSTRVSPHTDLGVITCLFQDDIGGLEVQDQESGLFIPIENSGRNEMVVNVSETFQRWTNDRIKAGVHRVTYPHHFENIEEGIVPPRYSNTCFVKADRHTLVGALDAFQSEKHPSLYENVTALEYHQQRVATAYGKNST